MSDMKKRVFRRKIYNAIGEWKRKSNGQTALLIEGARRIGKSTIVEKFAQEEYRSYILIKVLSVMSLKMAQRIGLTQSERVALILVLVGVLYQVCPRSGISCPKSETQ